MPQSRYAHRVLYGRRHREIRRGVKGIVESGNAKCPRCGKVIDPSEPWDLGHDDTGRALYSGPEHRRCNRATAGRRGRRVSVLV